MKNILQRIHTESFGDTIGRAHYNLEYMTTEALGSGTITFTIPASIGTSAVVNVSYRKNNGAWITTANSSSDVTISVNVVTNDVVEWKANATRFAAGNSSGNYSYFSSTCQCNIYGNILSLLYADEFINKYTLKTNVTNAFNSIFNSWTNLIDASNLILPITEISTNDGGNMYACMFKDCTSLIYPPNELPEITASSALSSVYVQMFEGCTSLIKCPNMDWGVLGNCNHGTFYQMFNGCTALSQNIPNKIEVEEYSATSSYTGLFRSMFQDCTHITTIPSLIIHNYTGANSGSNHGAFNSTFRGCTSLIDISNKALSILNNSNCESYYDFYNTFIGCTSLEKTPLLKIPETRKNTFLRTFENVRHLTDLYLDIDTIYSTNTVADEAFYTMFANTGTTSSGSAYRGNNSMLHLYGTVNSASAFSNSHGIWHVTTSGSTGYAGWSPYWTVVEEQITKTIYIDDFPEGCSDLWDGHGLWNQQAMEDVIYRPERFNVDTYVYDGDSLQIGNKVYYIWRPANVSWNSLTPDQGASGIYTILTTTVDYKRLYSQSLIGAVDNGTIEYRNLDFGVNPTALYALLVDDSTYRDITSLRSNNFHIVNLSTTNIEDEV